MRDQRQRPPRQSIHVKMFEFLYRHLTSVLFVDVPPDRRRLNSINRM